MSFPFCGNNTVKLFQWQGNCDIECPRATIRSLFCDFCTQNCAMLKSTVWLCGLMNVYLFAGSGPFSVSNVASWRETAMPTVADRPMQNDGGFV
jgi:hypothetical protein